MSENSVKVIEPMSFQTKKKIGIVLSLCLIGIVVIILWKTGVFGVKDSTPVAPVDPVIQPILLPVAPVIQPPVAPPAPVIQPPVAPVIQPPVAPVIQPPVAPPAPVIQPPVAPPAPVIQPPVAPVIQPPIAPIAPVIQPPVAPIAPVIQPPIAPTPIEPPVIQPPVNKKVHCQINIMSEWSDADMNQYVYYGIIEAGQTFVKWTHLENLSDSWILYRSKVKMLSMISHIFSFDSKQPAFTNNMPMIIEDGWPYIKHDSVVATGEEYPNISTNKNVFTKVNFNNSILGATTNEDYYLYGLCVNGGKILRRVRWDKIIRLSNGSSINRKENDTVSNRLHNTNYFGSEFVPSALIPQVQPYIQDIQLTTELVLMNKLDFFIGDTVEYNFQANAPDMGTLTDTHNFKAIGSVMGVSEGKVKVLWMRITNLFVNRNYNRSQTDNNHNNVYFGNLTSPPTYTPLSTILTLEKNKSEVKRTQTFVNVGETVEYNGFVSITQLCAENGVPTNAVFTGTVCSVLNYPLIQVRWNKIYNPTKKGPSATNTSITSVDCTFNRSNSDTAFNVKYFGDCSIAPTEQPSIPTSVYAGLLIKI